MERVLKRVASVGAKVGLPEDVLVEILSRLRVRSLICFRSVCKTWYSLIQSPDFLRMHCDRTKDGPINDSMLVIRVISTCPSPVFYIEDRDTKVVLTLLWDETSTLPRDLDIRVLSPSLVTWHRDMRVFGPIKGLFCITDVLVIVLFNPATRESMTLPESPGFEPTETTGYPNCVGFGFDPVANDYKVVRITDTENYALADESMNCLCKVEIFSLSTSSWRGLDFDVPSAMHRIESFKLFFNGALHWSRVWDFGVHSILAFDIKDEVFKRIQLPVFFSLKNEDEALLVLNEALALIVYSGSHLQSYMDIWVMLEYGVKESWTKRFSIKPDMAIDRPLSFGKDGEILLDSNGQLVSLNLYTGSFKEFKVHGILGSLQALRYRESLISIKGCKEVEDDIDSE